MKITTALFFAAPFFAAAQAPQVPHKMSFAGMTLTIRDDARREIQKDVDAITHSPKYFYLKADRAKTYFPVIEKIFREEGVPDDFKYLVIQESALIADAVSSSNAVGFWQFKDFTAIEMGLRVDNEVDERKNIAASTRAAANYIKKNNTFFDNWLYALQAYQMGAGGVLRSVEGNHSGEKHAEITSQTYWYVKKFLAHKIAYGDAVKGKGQVELTILESDKTRKSLAELSRDISIPETELVNYNKWILAGSIPEDKRYPVIVPVPTGLKLPEVYPTAVAEAKKPDIQANPRSMLKVRINGITVIQAIEGENAVRLAERANADLASFLKWNDISYSTAISPGAYYFLGKKRARASEDFHTVSSRDDLWSVSQKYGVMMRRIKKYNRLKDDRLTPGTTLWLTNIKPKSVQHVVNTASVVDLDKNDPFNWTSAPENTIGFEPGPDPGEDETKIAGGSANVNPDSVESISVPIVYDPSAVTSPGNGETSKILQPQIESKVSVDTAIVQAPVFVQPVKGQHIVQPKENLYTIAKMYGMGVMDLVKLNNLDLQEKLKIGQVLKLSNEAPGAADSSSGQELYHEVQVSDTLYGIARKYGVTIREIMEWNEKKDFSLSVGEKLKVKALQ